jgi:hypothetical protein
MRFALIATLLLLAGCGGTTGTPDAGTHCGNGNVYCQPGEVCVSGDCLPGCYFTDAGC